MFEATDSPLESIVLVVDLTSSAETCWDQTRNTAQILYSLLPGEIQSIYSLGSSAPVTEKLLEQNYPPSLSRQSSLIAPIMESLLKQNRKHSVMIVGSGKVFDLDDWLGHPSIESWLLVCTGEESLHDDPYKVSQIVPSQIEDAETVLGYFGTIVSDSFADDSTNVSNQQSLSSPIEWDVDPTGYPMMLVDPLKIFVQLFPITKPQFEKFMFSGKARNFNDDWYSDRLAMNPRASYRSQDDILIEQLLLTGLTVKEITDFSKWLGRDYSLLTAEEWKKCHEWFSIKKFASNQSPTENRLSKDAQRIKKIIETQNPSRELLQLSLMERGIPELVVERLGEYGEYYALGDPASGRYRENPFDPILPIRDRMDDWGFRLCTRGRQ